jgi:threonine dehydrogenase-like Zn-dependent dehydrogenase
VSAGRAAGTHCALSEFCVGATTQRSSCDFGPKRNLDRGPLRTGVDTDQGGFNMKALVLQNPGQVSIQDVPEPVVTDQQVLLKVRMVGFCGSDLNSFRGLNPLVSFPRILGHEVCATIVQAGCEGGLTVGTDVAVSPYTSCGRCASCRRGRPNACQFNQTLGVQRDGALTEFIAMPREKLYPANLTTIELCLVEPLTVGFHAVARGRVTADDTVAILGCGGVGLGAVAASSSRGATTICGDQDVGSAELSRGSGREFGSASRGSGAGFAFLE